MSKDDYEPIPDVDIEQGIAAGATNGAVDDMEALAKKYPEANDLERKFLSKLDYAIENAKPKVSLPKAKERDFGPPQSISEFISAIKYPSAALVVTVSSALAVAGLDSPVAEALFPYYSCILTYLSGVPATKGELDKKANAFFSKVEGNKAQAEKKLDGVSETAIGLIDTARNTMEVAIKPIKKTLDAATELEAMLRKVDPTIDIPDTSDIENSFNGISDKVTVIPTLCKKAVDVSRKIPKPLQSKQNFDNLIIYPILAVFLILQLVAVWQTQHQLQSEMGTATDVAISATDSEGVDGYRFLVVEDEEISGTAAESSQFVLVSNAIASYIGIVIQIVITFVMAQVAVVVATVNGIIEKVENSLNDALEEKAAPIFRTVFEEGFGEIKRKMLELINEVEKIEAPMEKARSMKEKMEKMKALDASSLPVPGGVKDAIPGNLTGGVSNAIPGNLTGGAEASVGNAFNKFGM